MYFTKSIFVATALLFIAAAIGSVMAAPLTTDSNKLTVIHPSEVLGDFNVEAKHQALNSIPLSDCKEIYDEDNESPTGIYELMTGGKEMRRFKVFCDMKLNNGGWTLLMRRKSDSNFNRNWAQYRNGFGDLNNNFWIGLENMHALTKPSRGRFQLYIGLESHTDNSVYPAIKGEKKYAIYDSFKVGSEDSYYQLTISGYDNSSTAGDSLKKHNDMSFSTPDRDNDKSHHSSCAHTLKSGWWFKNCLDSNLAGKWWEPKENKNDDRLDGIVWEGFKGETYSLKSVIMAIRKVA